MALKSLFGQLFLIMQDHIKNNCPSIRWIDHDLGQLEDYNMRPAVSFPCVLIDFNQTSFEQMQRNAQLGNLTFTLRIGFPPFSNTNSVTPVDVKEKGLQFYEIEQEVYEAIQGFGANGLMQDCTRVNSATERREDDNLRVRVLTFTSQSEDYSACPSKTKVPRPDLDFS